jgi:hypothetical protein
MQAEESATAADGYGKATIDVRPYDVRTCRYGTRKRYRPIIDMGTLVPVATWGLAQLNEMANRESQVAVRRSTSIAQCPIAATYLDETIGPLK